MKYLRKISNNASIEKINESLGVGSIPADILKHELRTTQNTLSLWKFDGSSDSLDKALKSALLADNSLDVKRYIILTDDILRENGLEVKESINKTGYIFGESLHCDIVNLNYEKIGFVLKIYKDIISKKAINENEHILKINRLKIKELVMSVIENKELNKENLQEGMNEKIEKIKQS